MPFDKFVNVVSRPTQGAVCDTHKPRCKTAEEHLRVGGRFAFMRWVDSQ